MKFPKLIRGASTPIKGELYGEEIRADGTPDTQDFETVCIFQSTGGKRVYTKEEGEIVVSSQAFVDGNLCPDLKVLSGGSVQVMGTTYEVAEAIRNYNPDGTINFVKLVLK